MRLGLYGGTFDPIHLGHLILAETCREACGLDRVWFVVAGAPPHKPGGRTDVAHRLAAGTVFVNTHGMSAMDMQAPMGGWKASGFGVELGPEGMAAFTRPRVVLTNPGPASAP